MEWSGLLSLAFALGLIHAMDADHLVAVSALSGSSGQSWRQRLSFSMRWALGHGASVLIMGSLVLLFGLAIPAQLSVMAEQLVGIMLLIIGLFLLTAQIKKWLDIQVRSRPYLNPVHAHRHGTVLVGLIHGIAGFVPLLALLSLGQPDSPMQAMTSLVVFCLAVLVAMVVMGGFLAKVFNALQTLNTRYSDYLSFGLGVLSISMGMWLVIA